MKAKKVNEIQEFKRGENPYDKLNIGIDPIMNEFVEWADLDFDANIAGAVDMNFEDVPEKFKDKIEEYCSSGESFLTVNFGNAWLEGFDYIDEEFPKAFLTYTDAWEKEHEEINQ